MRSALEILAVGLVVVVLIIIIPNLATISAGLAMFGSIFLQWLQLVLYGVLIVGGGSAIIAAYVVIDKRRELRVRQQDGSFPLMEFRRGSARVIVDPNKMVGSGGVFHESVGWQELLPAAGWEIASRHSAAVQMTRTAQAIAPGDNAIIGMDRYKPPSIPSAAVNPRAIPAQLKAEMEEPPDIEAPRLPAPVIAPQELIDRNQPTKLALGQDVDTGEIVYCPLEDFPFLRVHGSTRSGKTALAKFLVVQALQHGYEVVIYDTRMGKDWGIFRDRAQVIYVHQPGKLLRHVEKEFQRYEERGELLGRHNAPDLAALAHKTGETYRRRLIVIEEMGNQQLSTAAENKTAANAMATQLSMLTSQAGATGIHGLYLDQMPKEWDPRIRYNSAPIIFHLPKYGGDVAGYQAAHQLAKYHCWFDDRIIRTGHMEDDEIVDALSGVHTGTDTPHEPYFGPDADTPDTPDTADSSETITERQHRIIRHFEENPDDGIRSAARTLDISKSHVWQVRQMMLRNEIDADCEVE